MEAARAELAELGHIDAQEAAEAPVELDVAPHGHDGHTHEAVEATSALSLFEEVKMEAAQRGSTTSKSMEMQAACGCGTCPPCLSITVWNAASLIVPAAKVMARRRRNKSH